MGASKNGGPAFPQLAVEACERDGHGDLLEPFTSAIGGATLLDYFAAHALSALIAAHPEASWKDIATTAYVAADAMLAEREKGEG